MAKLFEDTVSSGATSAEITVVDGTIVSLIATGMIVVFAKNGDSGGFVPAFEFDPEKSKSHTPQFVAPSTTIKLHAPKGSVYASVYGN